MPATYLFVRGWHNLPRAKKEQLARFLWTYAFAHIVPESPERRLYFVALPGFKAHMREEVAEELEKRGLKPLL